MVSKKDNLLRLAISRKNSRWDGYDCISDFHGGVYECNYVSPYTIGAHNADSPLMILLQDWASSDVLSGPILHERYQIGHDSTRPTNVQLQNLLFDHFKLKLRDTYATNVFPFVKRGPMKSQIDSKALIKAAEVFAIPQIEIVAPRFAVCFGKDAFRAVATAAGHRVAANMNMNEAISSPFMMGTTKVWCQAHTGRMGVSNRGGIEKVSDDWATMSKDFFGAIVES